MAGAIALALLAGIAPLNALSSAAACAMPCCASVGEGGACATGACHSKISGHARNEQPPVKSEDSHSSHCSSMRRAVAPSKVTISPLHVSTVEADSSAARHRHPASGEALSQKTGVVYGAFTKPCPPECCAGASTFAQVRRSRDVSALSHNLRPRPPTIAGHLHFTNTLLLTDDARLSGSSPRAPPLLFS
jgi:hypothetical protein